jgi:electron transfer flavoprotein alpha subunit
MAGVLVFGEIVEGALSAATLRLATAGAAVADALGEPLSGALVGDGLTHAADAFRGALSKLYIVEGVHYRPYTAEACVLAARAVVDAAEPSVILAAHGAYTREWVPCLAAQLAAGLVMGGTGVCVEDGALIVSKPVNGGAASAEFVVRGRHRVATLQASHYPAATLDGRPERIGVTVAPPAQPAVAVIDEDASTSPGGVRLKDAKVIVSGGRGVGGPENWHLIENASAVLGGAVGCSRPVADSGWVASSHQVGLSGTTVSPDLYIAVGISGAAQHLAGIVTARKVVAINSNAEADIFSRADYGVVGDCSEVLPAFIERVKELRARVARTS